MFHSRSSSSLARVLVSQSVIETHTDTQGYKETARGQPGGVHMVASENRLARIQLPLQTSLSSLPFLVIASLCLRYYHTFSYLPHILSLSQLTKYALFRYLSPSKIQR